MTVTGGGRGGTHRYYALYASSSNNSLTIGGLGVETSYMFAVTATANGHTTGYSYTLAATTTGPQPPANVRLTALTSTTLTLAWDPSPGPAQNPIYSTITSYSISQYTPAYPSYTLAPKAVGIPTNITTGTVTGLAPGSSAWWSVQAFDAQGHGSSPLYYLMAVTNPVPAAARLGAVALPGGGFQFSVTEGGSVLQTVVIQATTNLADPNSWVQMESVLPAANPFVFTDTNASQYPALYYRIITP